MNQVAVQASDPIVPPLRILHLEDDANDADLIRRRLVKEQLNPVITLVRDGAGFEAALKARKFDVILSDRALGNYDGFAALELARQIAPATPFIFVCGDADDTLVIRAIQEGATDVVAKDQLGRLCAIIRRNLLKASEHRAAMEGLQSLDTERIQRASAEAALRASENHYRLLFESSPTPIYVYDREVLAFLAVNEAAVRHYGYSREEFAVLTLRDLALPEDLAAFLEKQSRLTAQAEGAGIWRHRKKGGKICEMEITSHALMFEGKPTWLSLAMDVTERLNLEAQLRQSQKMESVGQLAGGIAHDFNNLLTVINGHAGLLLAKEEFSPRVKDSLKEISAAARRAADLTRQLLAFSRKQVLHPQVVDLSDVVKNVSKMLHRVLGEDIAVQTDFATGVPCVKADLGMMEQVLLNLAVNSRDAMPGGGKLRIQTTSETVNAAHAQQNPEANEGSFVCLTIADTGCGIPPENLPRIFEPFFTTKELDRGTGLGLATVYGIVRQHQGWIEVTSELKQGTTFKIFLPSTSERSGEVTMPAGEQRIIGGTETILVVEDEAPLLKLIRHILESYGYKVLDASSGRTALDVWPEFHKKIDLLLTDMVLPDGMTGPELAKTLQESKPGLKVIFISGYSMEKVQQATPLQEGINFIQKPFHARKLAETVHDCLNRK